MGIPKSILHPLLLLSGAALVLWLVWSKIPTAEDVRQKASVQNQNAPDSTAFVGITDFAADGRMTTQDGRTFQIDDERLKTAPSEGLEKLRALLVGKTFNPAKNSDGTTLHLPIELYDPLCFKPQDKTRLHCPIVLEK
jgi:hypothetical protein